MFKRVTIMTLVVFLLVTPQKWISAFGLVDRLTINNFTNGETIAYDLPLLKGTAPGSSSVLIQGIGWTQRVSVTDGRWRAFVLLRSGPNQLAFTTEEGYQFTFTLTYNKSADPLLVRMVYVLGSDSPGEFDAPAGEPRDLDNAVKRLKVGARMLQSMTAELLYEKGLPRRTFQLVTDTNGEPVVDVTVVPLTVAQLRAMNGTDLWYYFYGAFSGIPNRNNIKDITIIADTHYESDTGTLLAHTALGGGRLGLFGSATLYAWPETTAEIESHFTDSTPIPADVFPEYGRAHQFWATYTTSLGAVLHEFGHCVGLDHPQNPSSGDIMYRGFDFLNRLAVTYEPGFGNIDPATTTIMPKWTDADIATLQANPWMKIVELGDGAGGPVAVPGILSTLPNTVVFMAAQSKPVISSQVLKVNLSWLDVNWTAQSDGPLMFTLDKTQGKAGDNLTITINTAGYELGSYNGSITITSADSSIQGSPLTVPIKLYVVDEVRVIYLPIISR